MTINEAIIYAEEMAATDGNRKRQDNYNQIAEWLKDYKRMLQQEPCEDCISRQAVIDACDQSINLFEAVDRIKELSSVTPQLKTGRCKDCNYFEYDSVAIVDGVPLIVAHEICKKWSDGCKTSEDGYCFLFEPQESEG